MCFSQPVWQAQHSSLLRTGKPGKSNLSSGTISSEEYDAKHGLRSGPEQPLAPEHQRGRVERDQHHH